MPDYQEELEQERSKNAHLLVYINHIEWQRDLLTRALEILKGNGSPNDFLGEVTPQLPPDFKGGVLEAALYISKRFRSPEPKKGNS
jgi:hypothetical protein